MKSVFAISIILLWIVPSIAQEFAREREIRITEKELGKVSFHFTDNDNNGQYEFITDANNKAGIFTGEIIDNEIVTHHYKRFTNIYNDLKDLRLEDTDKDGKKELYALYESEGLLILDTTTLIPLDMISEFPVGLLFRRMLLADIDHDQINEWIMLDGSNGITVFELNTFTPKWNDPQLQGLDMQLGNLDDDAALELVLHSSTGIRIINIETLEEEHFISSSLYEEIELTDLNQDGIDELILIDGTQLEIYDHATTSILDNFSTGGTHFDDRFYLNLDADTALEIILYQPDFNAFIELNTYPLTLLDNYELPDDVSLGWYSGQIPGEPGKFVFIPDEGISIFDIVTKTVVTTKITGYIAGILSTKFDHIADEVLITHPAEANWDYLTFRTLNDFKAVYKLSQDDLFEGHIADFASTVDRLHTRGLHSNNLLINNNREFSIYDPVQNTHIDYLDLQGDNLSASDLDHDGSDELINILNNSIHVYQQTSAGKFQHLFSTAPTELYTNFRTGQLDQTPEKEIVAFNFQEILVYSGRTGALLHEVTGIPSTVIQDVTTFSDHTGDFFIAVMNSGTYYVYNYTKKMLAKTFNFYGSTTGYTKIFQVLDAAQLKTYILIHSDRFQVYTTAGNPVFIEDLATGSNNSTSKIIINDYNQDSQPDILLSGGSKFTTYTYTGTGESVESFYTTSLFPKDSIILNSPTSYVLQFSEPILPGSVPANLVINSKRQGNLDFDIEWLDEFQVKVTHEPLLFTPDTITLMIHGGLQSDSQKFLDNNLDGISMHAQETIEHAVYVYDANMDDYKPTILPLSNLPALFYAESMRHLAFQVNSDIKAPFPIHSMHSGILSGEIHTSLSLQPVDRIFDEPVEGFSIPVPTFGLTEGTYRLYLVGGDVAGNLSDTFFLPFQVISEKGNYDKNAGGGSTRTQFIDNKRITSYFKPVHTKLHPSTERLSHIVGGDGYIYYLVENPFDRLLTFRKANLPDFETIWEHVFPSYSSRSSIHLSDGFVYFIKNASQGSEFRVFAYDALSGEEIWNEQIYSRSNLTASPITDDENVLVTGGEYGGTYCFNRWTGEQKWYSKRDNTHFEEGIPAMYKNAAYLVEHTSIKSIDLGTGQANWEIEVNEEEPYLLQRNALVDTIHQQLIWPGKNNIYAFDLETGEQKWRRPGSNSIKNPVQFENLLFLFKSNSINKVNASTGINIETLPLSAAIKAQPVGSNGKLFLPLADRFEVLDMVTLATLWTLPMVVQEITIIDQYMLLTDNMYDVHVFESVTACCNSSVEWTETEFTGHIGEAFTRKYTYDSIPIVQNGIAYHEILASDFENGGNWQKTDILIREEAGKIYQWFDTGEKIIIDFNLELHDTFENLTVVAIDTIILENGESRKRLELHCSNWTPIYWIDGIGSTAGLVLNQLNCFADVGVALLCHYQDGELLYDDPDYNTCWLQIVATDELEKHSISFFPNPANDLLSISDPDHLITDVSIFDLRGQVLSAGLQSEIDISRLRSGCYQLCIVLKTGERIYDRFIKI